jgi:hypothetical protein
MTDGTAGARLGIFTAGMFATLALWSVPALAQTPAEGAPPADMAAPPADTAAPVAAPMPPPPPPPMAPMVVAPPPPPPPEAAPDYKKINMGVGIRVGGRVQSGTDSSKLTDFSLDEIYVESRFSGQLTPIFAWQANFNANIPTGTGTAGAPGAAGIMDLIAKFEPDDAFHLWAGRMLVPSDRSNFSGTWFMSPWKYPGLFPTASVMAGGPVGPKEGANGRNDGVTAWGQFMGGKAKYYLSAFDLNEVDVHPLYSGRINICLLGSEPGYYHSSTYYGSQDILAIGLGGQYQKGASGGGNNLENGMVDVLFEKNLGPGGVVTVEGEYYKFDSNQTVKQDFYVLASWLTPNKLGIGKLQPLVRYQQATPSLAGAPTWKMIDAYLTYVINDYFLRAVVGYQYADVGTDPKSNAILLGIQMQR